MNSIKYFLVFAMVASLGACRTTIFIPPSTSEYLPPKVLLPTSVDPVEDTRKRGNQPLAQIETPGHEDFVELKGPLVLVSLFPDSSYSVFQVDTVKVAVFKKWVRIGKEGVLVDETNHQVGLVRFEFDTLRFQDSQLRYSRVDSLNKRGNFLSKCILRDPEISWATQQDRPVPGIASYEIDIVDHTNSEYLLVPRVKGGGTGSPIRLERQQRNGLVTGVFYQPDLHECRLFKKDEKGRMFYGGRKLKKNPFHVVIAVSGKDYLKARGAKNQRHAKRDRIHN